MPSELPPLSDRLARFLQKKRSETGTFKDLEAGIRAANPHGWRVDRRKLANIAQQKPGFERTPLTLEELMALDQFFKNEGGLSAVLQPLSLLRAIAERGQVTFLLGAKPVQNTDHISRWDVAAMIELMRQLEQISPSVRIDIEVIPLRGRTPSDSDFTNEPWHRLIEEDDGPSLVAIGSPRACHGTEMMLSKMLGRPPFETPGVAQRDRLPFYFVWEREEADNMLPSAWGVSEAELSLGQQESAGQKVRAMIIKDEEYPVAPQKDGPFDTFGIIAAQRRARGQIWLACAGLSGTATLAGALMIRQLEPGLPPATSGKPTSILWAGIKGKIIRNRAKSGDARELLEQRFLFDPELLPLKDW